VSLVVVITMTEVPVCNPLEIAALQGTWVVFVSQDDEREIIPVGVGQLPEIPLLIIADKLNYKAGEDVKFEISGAQSGTLSLVVLTSSDQEKFSDTITLKADGRFSYLLNLDGYASGVYTTVISRANSQTDIQFSVGLQTGTSVIVMTTTKDTLLAGEAVLIIGNSDPNILITMTLFDQDGNEVDKKEIFTGKDGVFSTTFRMPIEVTEGIWTIESRSGPNFETVDILVISQEEEGLIIRADKSPPIYNRGQFVTFIGFGASGTQSIFIDIISADETITQTLSIFSTGTGEFNTIWQVPKDIDSGIYTIKVRGPAATAETTITIE